MKHIKLIASILTSVATIIPSTAYADEGMWLLGRTDPKAMAIARNLGLTLTDQQLYGEDGTSLKDCVLDFGDFCSGVIVSKDGLVFTNHHCGFGAIQKLSTPEDDILGNGFVARTHDEERPVEGLYVKIWQRTEDITAEVQAQLDTLYATKILYRKAGKNREAFIYDGNIDPQSHCQPSRGSSQGRRPVGHSLRGKGFRGRSHLLP